MTLTDDPDMMRSLRAWLGINALWRDHAACRGMDTNLFFPVRGGNVGRAKAVCAVCPVRQECLDYALDNGEKVGVFGGLSERQRRRIRGQRARQRPPTCGTVAGYDNGCTCRRCRDAHSSATRHQRARQRQRAGTAA